MPGFLTLKNIKRLTVGLLLLSNGPTVTTNDKPPLNDKNTDLQPLNPSLAMQTSFSSTALMYTDLKKTMPKIPLDGKTYSALKPTKSPESLSFLEMGILRMGLLAALIYKWNNKTTPDREMRKHTVHTNKRTLRKKKKKTYQHHQSLWDHGQQNQRNNVHNRPTDRRGYQR